MKRKQRISAIFIVIGFVMCMMNFFQTVSAAQTASLTLNCVKDNLIVSGMEWNIYYVAKVSGDKIQQTDTFKGYQVSLGDKSESSMSNLASTLYSC